MSPPSPPTTYRPHLPLCPPRPGTSLSSPPPPPPGKATSGIRPGTGAQGPGGRALCRSVLNPSYQVHLKQTAEPTQCCSWTNSSACRNKVPPPGPIPVGPGMGRESQRTVAQEAGRRMMGGDFSGCWGSLVRCPLLTHTQELRAHGRPILPPGRTLQTAALEGPSRALSAPGLTQGCSGGGWVVSNSGALPDAWHSAFGTPLGRLGRC